MLTKKTNRTKEVTNNLVIDWDEELERPDVTFYFDDQPYTYILKEPEDLGKLLSVFIGCSEHETVCKHSLGLKHVIEPVQGYEFCVAPQHDGDTPKKFFVNPFEALVIHKALEDKCADVMRNWLGNGSQDDEDNPED